MARSCIHFAVAVILLTVVEASAGAGRGDAKHGYAVYQQYCVRCHGDTLDGKGPDAASMKVPPTNFHAPHSRAKDEAELQFTVNRGRSFTTMHGWDEQLKAGDVRDVVAYIRSVVPRRQP